MNNHHFQKPEPKICPVCKDCEMKAGYIHNVKAVLNMWIEEEKFPLVLSLFGSQEKLIRELNAIPLADHLFFWATKRGSELKYKTYLCSKCNLLLTDLNKPQENLDPKQVRKYVLY